MNRCELFGLVAGVSVWVQKQFDKAAANIGGNWTYATYLLGEELFHPSARTQWVPSAEGLSSWDIEGSATFAGVDIMVYPEAWGKGSGLVG
jgi:hypothetical protein